MSKVKDKPAGGDASSKNEPAKLRRPQANILRFLSACTEPQTRKQIAEGTPTPESDVTKYVGSADDEVRKKNDETKFLCLLTLGYVKMKILKEEDRTYPVFTITASGRKAADRYFKEPVSG